MASTSDSKALGVAYQIPRNSLALLMVSQVFVILPLAVHISPWIVGVCVVCGYWRSQVYRGRWGYPSSAVKTLLVMAAVTGTSCSLKRLCWIQSLGHVDHSMTTRPAQRNASITPVAARLERSTPQHHPRRRCMEHGLSDKLVTIRLRQLSLMWRAIIDRFGNERTRWCLYEHIGWSTRANNVCMLLRWSLRLLFPSLGLRWPIPTSGKLPVTKPCNGARHTAFTNRNHIGRAR